MGFGGSHRDFLIQDTTLPFQTRVSPHQSSVRRTGCSRRPGGLRLNTPGRFEFVLSPSFGLPLLRRISCHRRTGSRRRDIPTTHADKGGTSVHRTLVRPWFATSARVGSANVRAPDRSQGCVVRLDPSPGGMTNRVRYNLWQRCMVHSSNAEYHRGRNLDRRGRRGRKRGWKGYIAPLVRTDVVSRWNGLGRSAGRCWVHSSHTRRRPGCPERGLLGHPDGVVHSSTIRRYAPDRIALRSPCCRC